jgi:hypothetical protein
MILVAAKIIVIECLIFFILLIGAIVLSHLGLLLVGRIDAFLSPENHQRFANSRLSGAGPAKRTTASHPELRGNN